MNSHKPVAIAFMELLVPDSNKKTSFNAFKFQLDTISIEQAFSWIACEYS